jgi:hypothetical protein
VYQLVPNTSNRARNTYPFWIVSKLRAGCTSSFPPRNYSRHYLFYFPDLKSGELAIQQKLTTSRKIRVVAEVRFSTWAVCCLARLQLR